MKKGTHNLIRVPNIDSKLNRIQKWQQNIQAKYEKKVSIQFKGHTQIMGIYFVCDTASYQLFMTCIVESNIICIQCHISSYPLAYQNGLCLPPQIASDFNKHLYHYSIKRKIHFYFYFSLYFQINFIHCSKYMVK